MENLNTPDVEALSLLQSTGNAFALASRGILPIINLFDAAQQLTDAKLPHIATQLYQVWLERTDSQIAYAAQFNLGVILSNINDDAGAEAAYRAAISEKPSFVLAYLNLGTLLECTGRSEDAVSVWRNALAFVDMDTPDGPALYVQILNNLGRIQETRGESDQSATDIMSNGDFGAGDASVQVKAYSHLLKQASSLKKVLAVYTVLLGDKECLGDPLLNLLPGSSSDLDI